MIIKDFDCYYRSWALFGGYYGKFVLKVENENITSIFDFEQLTPNQRKKLKLFFNKYRDNLPGDIEHRI